MVKYDVIICGGGPAGITAGIYAARYKMKALLISDEFGGYLNEINSVENYPGEYKISGMKLATKMLDHLRVHDIKIKKERIISISKGFKVQTDKSKYQGKSLLLALGAKHRHLGVPGEEKFLHKGVSYCAICDAPLFKDRVIGVVGGSNSAAQAALMLSKHAKTVYIIYRRNKLRAVPVLVDRLKKKKNVKYIWNANVTEILGNKLMNEVKLDTGKSLKLNGLFIEIGLVPASELAKRIGVKTDKSGRVKVDHWMATNVKGVFCAGDLNNTPLNQICVAAGQGAMAATAAFNFVKGKGKRR